MSMVICFGAAWCRIQHTLWCCGKVTWIARAHQTFAEVKLIEKKDWRPSNFKHICSLKCIFCGYRKIFFLFSFKTNPNQNFLHCIFISPLLLLLHTCTLLGIVMGWIKNSVISTSSVENNCHEQGKVEYFWLRISLAALLMPVNTQVIPCFLS